MNRNEFDRRMDGRGPMQGGMISHNRGGYMNRGGYSNRGGQQRGGMQNRGGPPRGGQNRGRGGYSNNKGGQQQRSGSNQSSNITVTPNKNIINVKPEKPQTPQPTKEETKTPVKAENKTPVKNEKTTPQSQKTTPQAQTQKTPTQVQQRPQQRTTPTSNNSSNMRPPSAPKTQTTPTPQNARPQSQSPSPRSQNQSSRPQGQNPKPQSQNPRPQSQSPSPQTQTTQQTQQSVTKSQQNQGRSQIQAAQPPPDPVADEDEQPADNQVQQQNESRQQQYNSGRQQNYNQNRNQGQNQGNRDNRKGDRFSQPRRDRNEYRQSSYHNRDDDERPTPAPRDEKKFTMRCRLFVGNLTNEISDEEFKEMFEPFGELSEVYVNAQRGFGFVRLDYKANAEAAKAALDGTTRKGRTLRVRFASHGAALKVRNLSPFVSNELLESAFSQMGEVERAIVICDDRGKSTGEGVVEFARKQNAQNAIKRINDGAFILTASPRPIFVEPLEQKDDEDGVAEKFLPKNDQYRKEREVEPRFAPPGSFEFTFAAKWKQIVDMEKNQMEQVKRNVEEAKLKLEGEMENAQIEHQEELIRQDLMRQQDELRRLQELRQQAELRRRQESEMRMRQLEEEDRMRQEQQQRRQDMMRRQDMRPMGGDTHNMGQEDMMMGPSGMSSSGNRGNAPPLPPPPAPPASMGLDRNRSQMAGSYGNQGMGGPMGMGGDAGLGGMPMGNQGAQMSQFDTSSGNAFGSGNSYQTQGGMANMGGSSGPGNMYNQGGMTGNNQGLRGNDRGMDRRREGGSRDDYPNDMKRVRRF